MAGEEAAATAVSSPTTKAQSRQSGLRNGLPGWEDGGTAVLDTDKTYSLVQRWI